MEREVLENMSSAELVKLLKEDPRFHQNLTNIRCGIDSTLIIGETC